MMSVPSVCRRPGYLVRALALASVYHNVFLVNIEVLAVSVQVIMKEGRPEWAVLPYAEYETLLVLAEQARASGGATAGAPLAEAPAEAKAEQASDSLTEKDRQALRSNLMDQLSNVSEVASSGGFSGAKATQVREAKGLDVAMVARDIGISPAYLQQFESGDRTPSEPILRNIARALDVDVNELSDNS